jgi:general secretion pathway protein I
VRPQRAQGFSLLEVMIALAVLAIALAATVRAVGEQARVQAVVRDAAVARWVASNVIAETRLSERFPATGEREGQTRMAGRVWRWRRVVSDTPDGDLRRIDVAVYAGESTLDGEDSLVRLSGFASGRDRRE